MDMNGGNINVPISAGIQQRRRIGEATSAFASFAFSVMPYIFDAIATAPEIAAGGYKGAMALDGSLHVARWVIAVFSFSSRYTQTLLS